jgi:hypothetical protein
MKINKVIFTFCTAILSLYLCSCGLLDIDNSVESIQTSSLEITQNTFSPDMQNEIGKADVEWVIYKSLEELVKASDQIFVGYISKIDTPIRVKYTEIGLKNDDEYTFVLPCKIQVKEMIKGNMLVESLITINQVVMYYAEYELLNSNETHLFFINGNPNERINSLRQYILLPPAVSYPKIDDGKVSVYEDNNVLSTGQSFEEVKAMIKIELEK